ncbi:glutamate racemase [Clostridium sp. DL1XJH146]
MNNNPIGFFDSGVGGLSVLKEAIKILPNEDFIYFGDSKNAPYGTKSLEEVKKLSFDAVKYLISKNVKAIVVACNTATSASINDLRLEFKSIPIIGIEPALKPATKLNIKGPIVIMATPMTLSEKKFKNLLKKYNKNSEIIPLPCARLVEFIEDGITEGKELNVYLKEKLAPLKQHSISSVVLGCTHYPFVKKEIKNIVGDSIPLIDGGKGTAKQLKHKLTTLDILNNQTESGKITIFNSLENDRIIKMSYNLLFDV